MISIIIPIYNIASHLERCLDSCFAQTYTDIEVLAINDGSVDRSGEILDNYAKLEPRLRVFHQTNKGVVVARNKGIENAQGNWLMFVDGDDYIPEKAVEHLLQKSKENNADIIIGGFFIVRGGKFLQKNNLLPYGTDSKSISYALLSDKLQFSLCGKIFRKSLFDGLIVPEELKIGEDAFMIIQIFDKNCKIEFINDPVYYYNQHNSSVMNKPSKSAVESRVTFIKYVSNFYLIKDYFEESQFQIFYGGWILNEYFGYLRMGGEKDYIDRQLLAKINYSYLNNIKVISILPMWRVLILQAYKASPIMGKCIMFLFNKIRVLFR